MTILFFIQNQVLSIWLQAFIPYLKARSLCCGEHFPLLCRHGVLSLYGGVGLWLVCDQLCSEDYNPVGSVTVHNTCQGKSTPPFQPSPSTSLFQEKGNSAD